MNSFSNMARPRAARSFFITVSALLLVLFAVSLRVSSTTLAAPEKTRHATVIVQFDDIEIAAREITFEKKMTNGIDALKLTGFAVVTTETQFGTAVCAVGGIGQPADDCFGDLQGRFWSYNYWDGTQWVAYPVGAGSSQVADNGIEGWRWGEYLAPLKPATPILAAVKSLNWLNKQQSATDGGYGSAGSTTNTQLAIGANDLKANKWQRSSTAPSLQTFQTANAKKYAKMGAAEAGKLAIAISGSSSCFPKNTKTPADYFNAGTGVYGDGTGRQAFGILGTVALAQTVPANAVTYLKSLQQGNGGWEWQPTWGTDVNSTALAIEALIAAGEANNSPAVTDALAYLSAAQNTDGGFPYDPAAVSHPSDGDSTAWAVQALIAAGEIPTAMSWTPNAANPIEYLMSLQLNNGSFQWQAGQGTNLLATQQIIPALLGRPYVFKARAYKECK